MKKEGNIQRRLSPGAFHCLAHHKSFTPLEKAADFSLIRKDSFSNRVEERSFLTGFTLVEILLVVLLLGVVAGLAVPNFSQLYSNLQLSEATKNVAFLMRYAQGRAIVKKNLHRLELDAVHNQCRLTQEVDLGSDQGDEEVSFQPISGKMGQPLSIPEGIKMEADKPAILFYPDGKIEKVRLYLRDNRDSYFTVSTQDQFGYVQIFEGKIE